MLPDLGCVLKVEQAVFADWLVVECMWEEVMKCNSQGLGPDEVDEQHCHYINWEDGRRSRNCVLY